MSLKAKLEAIIYAAEDPITIDQLSALVKDLVIAEQAQAAEIAQDACIEPSAEAVEAAASPDETAKKPKKELSEDAKIRQYVRRVLDDLVNEYDAGNRGMEIRQVAGGYRMSTRPEHHDVVRAFAKSLKPPVRLSLAALETLAVIAYKQPVTVPEISEIRGVESGGVIGTLLDRKLITTAGRKQVVGRPILYKTTKDFLMRFGLNDVNELPSMEEFEKLVSDQGDLFAGPQDASQPSADAAPSAQGSETSAETPAEPAESTNS